MQQNNISDNDIYPLLASAFRHFFEPSIHNLDNWSPKEFMDAHHKFAKMIHEQFDVELFIGDFNDRNHLSVKIVKCSNESYTLLKMAFDE